MRKPLCQPKLGHLLGTDCFIRYDILIASQIASFPPGKEHEISGNQWHELAAVNIQKARPARHEQANAILIFIWEFQAEPSRQFHPAINMPLGSQQTHDSA